MIPDTEMLRILHMLDQLCWIAIAIFSLVFFPNVVKYCRIPARIFYLLIPTGSISVIVRSWVIPDINLQVVYVDELLFQVGVAAAFIYLGLNDKTKIFSSTTWRRKKEKVEQLLHLRRTLQDGNEVAAKKVATKIVRGRSPGKGSARA
jgi:hypothetical protein